MRFINICLLIIFLDFHIQVSSAEGYEMAQSMQAEFREISVQFQAGVIELLNLVSEKVTYATMHMYDRVTVSNVRCD